MRSLVKRTDEGWVDTKTVYEEHFGKSTDEKPVLKPNRNGSVYFEMDTGEAYMWDGENLTWLLL